MLQDCRLRLADLGMFSTLGTYGLDVKLTGCSLVMHYHEVPRPVDRIGSTRAKHHEESALMAPGDLNNAVRCMH